MSVCLDHLVIGAASLAQGVAWCEATLGITPGPGGTHPLMGTHNRIFRVDGARFAQAFFEIIAIDPGAAPPGRARWFGLDATDFSSGPRLLHWVARSSALDASSAALRAAGFDPGPAIAATRDTPQGRLEWRLTVREDGALPAGGALPSLIEWRSAHPSAAMPPSGVSLAALTLGGLPPAVVQALELQGVDLGADPAPALCATLDTPRGRVLLCSV